MFLSRGISPRIEHLVVPISFLWGKYSRKDSNRTKCHADDGGLCLYIETDLESCKSAEIEVSDYFAGTGKMVEIGSNAMRDVDDAGFERIAQRVTRHYNFRMILVIGCRC